MVFQGLIKTATNSDIVMEIYMQFSNKVGRRSNNRKSVFSSQRLDIIKCSHNGHMVIQGRSCTACDIVCWSWIHEEVKDYLIKSKICCAHQLGKNREQFQCYFIVSQTDHGAVDLFQLQNQELHITVDYFRDF